MRIDSHQHFWKYDPDRDSWITDEMKVLKRNFLPSDLQPLLNENNMDGCVLVQSDQSEEGNELMLRLSERNSFIKGIVAWVDFRSDHLEEQLSFYKKFPIIKGFRHILQGEKNRAMMLESSFLKGIAALEKFDYTYDILIFNDQLKFVPEFLKHFPNQQFVLDHLAKPNIREHKIKDWEKEMRTLSRYPNLHCKISGMFAESDWNRWKPSDFSPYLDVVLEVFGVNRLMYGSDWPVCLVATTYTKQLEVVEEYFSRLPPAERQNIFGDNAVMFYRLEQKNNKREII